MTAGSIVLLAGDAVQALNGGLPTVLYAFGSLSLYGSTAANLKLETDATTIYEANYPAAPDGVSLGVSYVGLGATANDDPASFCQATTVGLFEGSGTPGVVNDPCP